MELINMNCKLLELQILEVMDFFLFNNLNNSSFSRLLSKRFWF